MLCTDAGLATLYEGGLTERSCCTAGERGTQYELLTGVCMLAPAAYESDAGDAKWLACENGAGAGGDMMALVSDMRGAAPVSLPYKDDEAGLGVPMRYFWLD